MNIDDDQNEESIPEGAILMIANNILSLLEYSDQLTDEEVLFSDEFYISILSNLLTDKKFEIQPGETSEQKIKNLKKLLKLLSEIIEMDLSQISPEGIIKKHDKYSAKSFLELLEELIKTLMNANLGEEESDKENENKSDKKNKNKEIKDNDDNEEIKNQSYSENDIDNIRKGNNSEGNIFGGNKNKFNLEENDEDEEINNYNRIKKGLDKDEEININDLKKKQNEEEEIIKDKNKNSNKSDKKISNNNSINKDNLDNINNSGDEENRISQESFRRLNQSNIEKLQLEKMLKNNDESYIRKTYSQNDLSAYEKQYAEREEENENDEEDFNENENEKSQKSKENEKKEENEIKIKKDTLSSPGEEENKLSEGALDLNYNLEDKNNLSGSPIMNVSHISELSKKEKEKDNEIQINSSDKKSNKNYSLHNNPENSDLNKSIKSIKTNSNKSINNNKNLDNGSKKKLDDDIPDLFIEKNKLSQSNKFEYEEEEDDEEKIRNNYKKNNYLDEEESNLEGEVDEEENLYVPNSVPRAYNKLHLPSASRESESSQKNKNKKELNKESNSSLTNSNISFHSKNSKKQSNKNIVDFNDISNSYSNKKNSNINTSTNKKNVIKKIENKNSSNKKDKSLSDNKNDISKRSNKSNRSNRSKQSQKSQRKTEEENDESLSDISKSSVYSNPHEKSVKSSASKKSGTSKKNKSFINSEKNISNKQEKTIEKYNYKDLINIEIPMTDEEIKNEIKKELKRLYGTKANQYYDKAFLELIIENIKLARKTILKLETGVKPDDNFSKEFMLKYQKEIQKILKYYIEQKKKEKIYKQNAIMSIGQNIKFIKKLKEAELKDILNDIENKKKEREIQNEDEQNQILLYPSYCYELQKQIYIAETQNQIDLNNAIEEEKKKSIDEAEKNYNNNIAIMYELLRRERRERINQKKLNERLEYELKNMNKRKLKKQIEDMLDQIDEEDRKIDNEDINNQEEIEKILNNFY